MGILRTIGDNRVRATEWSCLRARSQLQQPQEREETPPSGPGSAQPSLQAQAVYLQRAGCSGTQGGADAPLSGVQQRMLQRSGLG